ncbi:hypothetical protein F5X99DRAFT_408783 [Biscogniauxia marginata]|nr:hypothetical protein F5X99DRAFT_408783 [Biscogniauxia marginata]
MENQAQNNSSSNQQQQQQQQQQPPSPSPSRSMPAPSQLGPRRAAKNAAFREKLRQMALPLAPLAQLTTGAVHPAFPGTLLNFWLLTDGELEELAHYYHQRTPSRYTLHYPCPIASWSSDLPLEEKRRKIGRFIGLRGCQTPPPPPPPPQQQQQQQLRPRSEAELLDEARRARIAAEEEEDEVWRRKLPWYY